MNNYIINPMWFYWVNLLNVLHVASIVVGSVGIIILAVFAPLYLCGALDADEEKAAKRLIKFIPWFAVVIVIGLLIPPKEVMYQMMVAKYITEENLAPSVDAVKSAVDYIVQAVKGM